MLNSPPMFRQVPLRGLGRRTLGAFPDFDLPDFQMPDLDLSPAPAPALPPADGGAPAPAAPPAPGAEVPLAPAFQPRYVLPVQEQPPAETPKPEPAPAAPGEGGMSPLVWVGIAAVGVIAIVSLAK